MDFFFFLITIICFLGLFFLWARVIELKIKTKEMGEVIKSLSKCDASVLDKLIEHAHEQDHINASFSDWMESTNNSILVLADALGLDCSQSPDEDTEEEQELDVSPDGKKKHLN